MLLVDRALPVLPVVLTVQVPISVRFLSPATTCCCCQVDKIQEKLALASLPVLLAKEVLTIA